jgi:hypothetical protein
MALVVSGLLNKQIGAELDISEITVKAHRGSMTRKMKANSVAHLVNMAVKLGIAPCDPVDGGRSAARTAQEMHGARATAGQWLRHLRLYRSCSGTNGPNSTF